MQTQHGNSSAAQRTAEAQREQREQHTIKLARNKPPFYKPSTCQLPYNTTEHDTK